MKTLIFVLVYNSCASKMAFIMLVYKVLVEMNLD